MNHTPRILFIARAYPPTVGGMENFAQRLCEGLEAHAEVTTIINHHGKKALPAFLPYAAAKAIRLARRGDVDAVHLADALLAPVGAVIRRLAGVPVTVSVCGLDVSYTNRAYQAIVPRALRRLDLAMPISAATDAAMRARTGDAPSSQVIPLGVNPLPLPMVMPPDAASLQALVARRRVLITVGRLIERKGHAWFTRAVLPLLPPDVVYVVVGAGPQREAIAAAAEDAGVGDRIVLTGRLDDNALACAYAMADAFVMPNLPVAGDMEGFGLVALEASAAGVPVIASRLEGITEAVHHGGNGILVDPLDAPAFAEAILDVLDRAPGARKALGETFAAYTHEQFSWDRTAARYAEAIADVITGPLVAMRRRVRNAA